MKFFDKFLGWATPLATRAGEQGAAQALGHVNPHDDCLPWRQGKCPGPGQCADCNWNEGTSRQQD